MGCSMSKLFELKDWLSLAETTKHLSPILKVEVSEADVLRLGIDDHLKISIRFLNGAGLHKLIPIQLTPEEEDILFSDVLEDDTAEHPDKGRILYSDGKYYQIDHVLEVIEREVCDLSPVGGGRDYLEDQYQTQTDGHNVVVARGLIVKRSDGQLYQIQKLDYPFYDDPRPSTPATSLPKDSALVVRPTAIQEFLAALLYSDHPQSEPLDQRAETTYLNIIGGLLEIMLNKTMPGSKHRVFGNQSAIIQSILEKYNDKHGISQRTLDDKFAKAKRTLKDS